jgi:hypothetical protein
MGYKLAFEKEVTVHISTTVKEFNKIAAEHILENKTLAETRNTLLPKLSGVIDLSSFGDQDTGLL